MVGKIWIFLVVAGLVAAVVSSIQADSGTGMSYKIWVTNKLLNKVNWQFSKTQLNICYATINSAPYYPL